MPYPEYLIGRPYEHVGLPLLGHGQNATLEDRSVQHKDNSFDEVKLWVQEISADFSLAATTAQGPLKRDLYPHNFVQPSYTFSCQSPNQEHRARVAEFVRRSQLRSLQGLGLLRIYVPAAGLDRMTLTTSNHNNKTKKATTRRIVRNQKGARSQLALEGYIQSIPRGDERFVNAPDFQFNFIVSRSLAGPFQDDPISSLILGDVKTWQQLLAGDFINDPDKAKAAAKAVLEAKKAKNTEDSDDYERTGDLSNNLQEVVQSFKDLVK